MGPCEGCVCVCVHVPGPASPRVTKLPLFAEDFIGGKQEVVVRRTLKIVDFRQTIADVTDIPAERVSIAKVSRAQCPPPCHERAY